MDMYFQLPILKGRRGKASAKTAPTDKPQGQPLALGSPRAAHTILVL